MPAKRTVPTRRPLSSRVATISPGMPRHIAYSATPRASWVGSLSSLALRENAAAHLDVGVDPQHQQLRGIEVVVADVERPLAFGFDHATAVAGADRDLALDALAGAVKAQLAGHAIAMIPVDRLDAEHLAPDARVAARFEAAL